MLYLFKQPVLSLSLNCKQADRSGRSYEVWPTVWGSNGITVTSTF